MKRTRRVPHAIVCYNSRASGDAQAEAKSEISMSRLTFPGCASGPKVLCTNAIDIPLSWGSRSSTRRSQAIRPSSLRATAKACGSPDPPRQSVLRRRRVRTSGRMPSPPRPPAAPILTKSRLHQTPKRNNGAGRNGPGGRHSSAADARPPVSRCRHQPPAPSPPRAAWQSETASPLPERQTSCGALLDKIWARSRTRTVF